MVIDKEYEAKTNQTKENIRNMTVEDVKQVFASLDDSDYKLMQKAFSSLQFHRAEYILEIAVYRMMQGDLK